MRVRPTPRCWSLPIVIAAAGLSFAGLAFSQGRGGQPQTPPPNASTDPLLRGFTFRSIGPAVMMGRVDDIQGSEKDPMLLYVGFATGGLWKSTDGGLYWHSMFDNMANESVGSIAISASNPVQESANRTVAYSPCRVHPFSVTSEPVKTATPEMNDSIARRISSRVTLLPAGLVSSSLSVLCRQASASLVKSE